MINGRRRGKRLYIILSHRNNFFASIKHQEIEPNQDIEQPFPDSWISTTAPIALGALTDLSTEVLFTRGTEGAKVWRNTVGATYLRWCNGDITSWMPCEAVVQIATSELSRLMKRITHNVSTVCATSFRVIPFKKITNLKSVKKTLYILWKTMYK